MPRAPSVRALLARAQPLGYVERSSTFLGETMTLITRTRAIALLLLASVGLVLTACAPEPTTPYYGIIFNAPAHGYVYRVYTPKPTATSGLPVTVTLDPSSTACDLTDGVLYFARVGNCVVNANQPGDATHPAAAQVQRTIAIHECPPLIPGIWTTPLGATANIQVSGTTFSGTADLTGLGFGTVSFSGLVSCEIVNMTFNGTPLQGTLSFDGKVLASNYNGIDIVLNAPA